MDLFEKIDLRGHFNLAMVPEQSLPGYLHFDPDSGVELELLGHFDEKPEFLNAANLIIQGFTSNGKEVTLLNCRETSHSMNFPGIPQSKYRARYLLIGGHFGTENDLMFSSLRFTLKDINFWLGISGFKKPVYDNVKKTGVAEYQQPEDLVFSMNDKYNLHIEFSYDGPADWFVPKKEIKFEQKVSLRIEAKPAKESLEELHEAYRSFLSLLSISYFGFPLSTKYEYLIDRLDKEQKAIECYYKMGVDYKRYKEHTNKHDFLFTYKDVSSIFPDFLQRWFTLAPKIDASIAMLTEVLMYRSAPLELQFISMAQALENFHRRLKGNYQIDPEKHKQRVADIKKAMKESLPEWEHTGWISDMLNFSNEPKLQQRLEEMVASIPPNIRKALLPNEAKFVQRLKQNRNYYTHYSESLEKKAGSLEELYILSEKCKILLIVLILNELLDDKISIEKIIIRKGVYLFNHLIKLEEVKHLLEGS